MDQWPPRVLILDGDPDTLIMPPHVLEQAKIDTAITWDEIEACPLLETAPFDLILIGDHPPELDAAAIFDDLSFRGACPAVLILRAIIGEKDAEHFGCNRSGSETGSPSGACPAQKNIGFHPIQGEVSEPWLSRSPLMASGLVKLWRLRWLKNALIPRAPRHSAACATAGYS